MRCIRVPLSALADLVLVLVALLGGAGVGYVLLPPATAFWGRDRRLVSIEDVRPLRPAAPAADTGQVPWPDTPNAPLDADPTPGARATLRGSITVEPPPARAQRGDSVLHERARDWRQDLQQIATGSHPVEDVAGAFRYPIAFPNPAPESDPPDA